MERARAPRSNRRRLAAAAAGLVALSGVATWAVAAATSAPQASGSARLTSATAGAPTGAARGARVTVTGTGTAAGTPDTMTLQMGATTNASTAAGALDTNDREIAALTAVFLAHGVKRSGIQTEDLSLSPNYDNSGAVTGYQASDDLTVTMHDLAHAGGVIDAAAHVVGNDVQIDGISFSMANTSLLQQDARVAAVRDAEAEAEADARAAGATLGPVMSIDDESDQPAPVVEYPPSFALHVAGAASSPVPVHAGSQQVTVAVRVVYSLRS